MADHQHHDPVPADHLGRAVGRVVAGGDPDLAGAAVRDRPVGDLPGRRADPGQRRHRADRRVHRRDHHHQPGPDRRRIVGHRRAGPPRGGVQLRLRGGLLAAQRPRSRADDPGRLPGHASPRSSPASSRSCSSIPWTATPDAEAIFSILWLGILGSGLAYLAVFRLFAALGRDADDPRGLPHPGRRDRARLPRPGRAGRRADHRRDGARHRRGRPGQQPVRPPAGVRAGAAGRGRRSDPRPAPQFPTASSSAPPTISTDAPIRRTASERSLASPSLTEPQAAAKTVADSRSGATPDNGATLSATRMHRYAASVSQPPTAARRAAAGP